MGVLSSLLSSTDVDQYDEDKGGDHGSGSGGEGQE